jgi:hypothetical protein
MIADDGWIGPEADGPGGGYRLIWARSLIFFAWTSLAEANKTWEQPIVDAMHNFNDLQVAVRLTPTHAGYVFLTGADVEEQLYWGATTKCEYCLDR